MIELELAVGGEELGRQPCDGIICATPSGSTAYNLSNGGPVLMWGLEAIALTYVAATLTSALTLAYYLFRAGAFGRAEREEA